MFVAERVPASKVLFSQMLIITPFIGGCGSDALPVKQLHSYAPAAEANCRPCIAALLYQGAAVQDKACSP